MHTSFNPAYLFQSKKVCRRGHSFSPTTGVYFVDLFLKERFLLTFHDKNDKIKTIDKENHKMITETPRNENYYKIAGISHPGA
jgi:hypothetical protein